MLRTLNYFESQPIFQLRNLRWWVSALVVAGLPLLNIMGLQRPPQIPHLAEGQSEVAYVREVTDQLHALFVNPPESLITSERLLHVSPTDNWILWVAGYAYPALFRRYESLDWRFAANRTHGLCSQQAKALVSLLKREGISAGVWRLDGHVVAWVRADGREIVADPDYGVVIDSPPRAVEADPRLAYPYYQPSVAALFGPEGNVRGARWFEDLSAASHFAYGTGVFWAKWLIPLLLIAVCLSGTRWRRSSSSYQENALRRVPSVGDSDLEHATAQAV